MPDIPNPLLAFFFITFGSSGTLSSFNLPFKTAEDLATVSLLLHHLPLHDPTLQQPFQSLGLTLEVCLLSLCFGLPFKSS